VIFSICGRETARQLSDNLNTNLNLHE